MSVSVREISLLQLTIHHDHASPRVYADYINNLIELQLGLNLSVALFSIGLADIDILDEVDFELNDESDLLRRSIIEICASLVSTSV